jgi:hypothetical protein
LVKKGVYFLVGPDPTSPLGPCPNAIEVVGSKIKPAVDRMIYPTIIEILVTSEPRVFYPATIFLDRIES